MGSYVQLFSLAEIPQHARNSPLPPHLGSYRRMLLVCQDRRHLFVTPWYKATKLTSELNKGQRSKQPTLLQSFCHLRGAKLERVRHRNHSSSCRSISSTLVCRRSCFLSYTAENSHHPMDKIISKKRCVYSRIYHQENGPDVM